MATDFLRSVQRWWFRDQDELTIKRFESSCCNVPAPGEPLDKFMRLWRTCRNHATRTQPECTHFNLTMHATQAYQDTLDHAPGTRSALLRNSSDGKPLTREERRRVDDAIAWSKRGE